MKTEEKSLWITHSISRCYQHINRWSALVNAAWQARRAWQAGHVLDPLGTFTPRNHKTSRINPHITLLRQRRVRPGPGPGMQAVPTATRSAMLVMDVHGTDGASSRAPPTRPRQRTWTLGDWQHLLRSELGTTSGNSIRDSWIWQKMMHLFGYIVQPVVLDTIILCKSHDSHKIIFFCAYAIQLACWAWSRESLGWRSCLVVQID